MGTIDNVLLFATGANASRRLLDLQPPKDDGLEVLRRIRAEERTKQLPVIVLTSSDEEKHIVDSYRFGANSYVQKRRKSSR